jgi:predicted TIM-barrel fold metal-dependent hydrolase
VFRAFNRWLDEDWGFAYREMIFAAPYISLIDVGWAVEELEWAIEHDARIVVMRSGPVADPSGYRSPGDTRYDPFWARTNEAGITVAFHGCDPGYGRYAADWGEAAELESFRASPVKIMLSPEPMHDTLAALIGHGVFGRHPNLRVATIENGSGWVHTLMKSMKKAFGTARHAFSEDPVETFRRHIWVSPFYEDGLEELAEMIGPQHMMMGSDFPHAEGIAEPTNWINDISSFSAEDQRWIMREAALVLSRRHPA